MDRYRTPLLTARETARVLKMPESTLDSWLATSEHDALVHGVAPEKRGWPRVPFVGIVEAFVLRSLRDLGISMADVRRAADIVRQEFRDPYALAKERIATDGIRVFVRLADESIIHARDRQAAIEEVLRGHLRYITWDASGEPRSLRLPQYPDEAAVVIDPDFAWGAPVLARTKAPIDGMVALWRTGESMTSIAEEYGLPVSAVEDVLRQAA